MPQYNVYFAKRVLLKNRAAKTIFDPTAKRLANKNKDIYIKK